MYITVILLIQQLCGNRGYKERLFISMAGMRYKRISIRSTEIRLR